MFNNLELVDKEVYVARLVECNGIAVYRFKANIGIPTMYYSRVHFKTYCDNPPYELSTNGSICSQIGVVSIRKANENERELLKNYELREGVRYE